MCSDGGNNEIMRAKFASLSDISPKTQRQRERDSAQYCHFMDFFFSKSVRKMSSRAGCRGGRLFFLLIVDTLLIHTMIQLDEITNI